MKDVHKQLTLSMMQLGITRRIYPRCIKRKYVKEMQLLVTISLKMNKIKKIEKLMNVI